MKHKTPIDIIARFPLSEERQREAAQISKDAYDSAKSIRSILGKKK